MFVGFNHSLHASVAKALFFFSGKGWNTCHMKDDWH